MPDERETPTPPEDQEREASLDQETLDALVGDSDGEDSEDLESLLSDLDGVEENDAEKGTPDIATDAGDMDNMEALIDQMESDGEAPADDTPTEESPSDAERDEMNDLLYQATLADVEEAEGEDAPAEEPEESPEDDLESLLSDLDGSEEESEDVETLLSDTDDTPEGEDTDVEAAAINDTPGADALETEEDVDALLADLDGDEDLLEETDSEETQDEPESDDLASILDEEESSDTSPEASAEGEEIVSEEDLDDEESADEDLASLLEESTEDEDSSSAASDEELDGEMEAMLEEVAENPDADVEPEVEEDDAAEDDEDGLGALLDGLDGEPEEPESDDLESEEELSPELEDQPEEPGEEAGEPTLEAESPDEVNPDESDEDVADLLSELELEDSDGQDKIELEDLVEDLPEEDSEGDGEVEADEEVDESLDGDETTIEEMEAELSEDEDTTDEESLELSLEDDELETVETEEDPNEVSEDLEESLDEDSDDLDSLLEDLEVDESEEETISDDSEAEDVGIELDADATEENAEEESSDEVSDMDSLLDDIDTEGLEESSEEDSEDLDSLLDDVDTDELEESSEEDSEDLDSLLDGLDDSDDDVSDELSLDLDEEGDDDLDSMFDDLDSEDEEESVGEVDSLDDNFDDEDLGDLFEENINVGVEEDVAHILATGKPAPVSDEDSLLDDDILNDFKTVQNSLISGEDEAGSITATILILDDDEDNRTLFKDALDVSDETYNFIEADTTDEALEALTSQDASLILMNLDGNIGDAGSFLEQVASNPDFPAIPIVVNSTENDEIEDAIRAGATDYFSRPLDVMDVEYQVPRKISNLIKLQKAEHLLADGAGSEASADSDDLDDLGLDDDMDEFDDLMLDDGDEDDGMDDLDDLLSGTDEDDGLLPEDLIAGVSTGGGGAATATRRKGKKRLIPITDQRRMIRERERKSYASKDRSSKLPLVLGMALLVIVSAGLSAVAVNYVMNQKQQEVATVTPAAPPKPAPVLQQPKMAQKDFEMAKQRTERPNTFQRQADEAKIRIRQTVQELESTGGAWWSPWRIMRNTGASLDRLVNRRQVSDIRDAFGVDRAAVNAGLQNRSTLDYLASVGFDMRGKSAEELNARETFELLSARQIKDTNQIVDILSSLQDKLAKDRTRQARRRARQKKTSETAALDRKPDVALPWVNRTVGLDTRNPVRETDEISQGSSMRQSTEHRDFWRTT